MMTPISVAVRIWAKTISIGILIFAIAAIISMEGWAILGIGLALFLGFFITSPLLIFISPLVKWSSRIPYSNRSRMASLIFFLFLMYLLIFIPFGLIVGGNYEGFMSEEAALFILSIIVVQFIAVRTTRKSLYKLYEQFTCSHD